MKKREWDFTIPSPKAEPFKQWLAMTGSRLLNEIQADPLEQEVYNLVRFFGALLYKASFPSYT